MKTPRSLDSSLSEFTVIYTRNNSVNLVSVELRSASEPISVFHYHCHIWVISSKFGKFWYDVPTICIQNPEDSFSSRLSFFSGLFDIFDKFFSEFFIERTKSISISREESTLHISNDFNPIISEIFKWVIH